MPNVYNVNTEKLTDLRANDNHELLVKSAGAGVGGEQIGSTVTITWGAANTTDNADFIAPDERQANSEYKLVVDNSDNSSQALTFQLQDVDGANYVPFVGGAGSVAAGARASFLFKGLFIPGNLRIACTIPAAASGKVTTFKLYKV